MRFIREGEEKEEDDDDDEHEAEEDKGRIKPVCVVHDGTS